MQEQKFYDLTNPQKSIWVTEEYFKGSAINNICGTALIREKVNLRLLEKSIIQVLKNNDIFKIKLCINNGNVEQYVSDYINSDIVYFHAKNYKDFERIKNEIVAKPFHLLNSHPYNFYIITFPNGNAAFCLNIHHILADSWTLGFLSKQVVKTYCALLQIDIPYEYETYSYVDYIKSEKEYKNSNRYLKDKKYWNTEFETIPELPFVPGSVTNTKHEEIISAKRLQFNLNEKLVSKIKDYCEEEHISLFNFFMAIYSIYIREITGLDDFVIGTPILNRTSYKEKNTAGMFINMAAFRVDFSKSATFKDFIKYIATKSLGMLKHQKYSYQSLIEDLRGKFGNIPTLYNTVFSYQITNTQSEEIFVEYTTDWTFNGNSAENMTIQVYDLDDSGKLDISYDYKTSIYSAEDIENIHERILYMIHQIISKKNILLEDLEILTPKEKNLLLNKFNSTKVKFKANNILDLFKIQVKKHPAKTAIVSNNKTLTYKELDEKSTKLASYMQNTGVLKNDIVGLIVERSAEMAIALIAILKCGATYLPIDPEYPIERINYIIDNSLSNCILVSSNTANLISDKYKKLNISLSNTEIYNSDFIFKDVKIETEALAYLIYTSGSTGNPKGVKISQNNLSNFVKAMKNRINFDENKTMVSVTTICFDIFGLEFWCSLCYGLTLVIANEEEQKDIKAFNKLCLKNNVTMIQTTPSRFSAFLSDKEQLEYLKNMSDIMIGGETLPENLLSNLKSITNARIYNMYGPTETTIWSTVKDLTSDSSISIGRPIANTTCYILDKNQKLLPTYAIGTLYIGGDGVSKGYYNNNSLTNEKFIKFNNNIIYNTGDLAYFTNSGEIIHLGRSDFQVKIRGYRIELEEIENAISKFPNIISSAVVCHTINEKQILCAYYTSKQSISEKEMKSHLLKTLPIYMVPNKYIYMEKMPHTPNGKIDRKQLSFELSKESKESVLPTNTIEKQLYDIIVELSKNNNVSMEDNLFALGLDSIDILNLSLKIKDSFNVEMSIKDLYTSYSLVELAAVISNSVSSYSSITKAEKKAFYPLSDFQKELFYIYQMDKNTIAYNVSCGFSVKEKLSAEKVKACFNKLINAQPSLRTSFQIVDNLPCQKIIDKFNFDIEVFMSPNKDRQKIIDNFQKPFDLSLAPLFRVELHYFEKETMVLIDSHHIVMDGTSIYILIRDFCKLYNEDKISTLNIDYIDYTVWENTYVNSNECKNYEEYWLSKINTTELPILNLPYDFPMQKRKSFNGSSIDLKIDKSLFELVNSMARNQNVSPYTLFISAFYILLYKYTRQTDIILGTPIDVRQSSQLKNVIGMFVNNALLRNTFDSSMLASSFIQNTHNVIKDALINQPYPYDILTQKISGDTSSLLDVVFTYQNPHNEEFRIENHKIDLLRPRAKTSKFNLLLEVVPDMNIIRIEYNTDAFKYNTAESILKHYLFILKQLLNNKNQKIIDFNIITEEEAILIKKFNSTDSPINSDTIISIFEETVKLYPNNIAVVCDEKSLTYNELNIKANNLAHYLISKGIGRNDIVCIMTNRSLETIVCMLGILKAGAAFFNVDPTYPIERTKYYISDSKTKYVLTQASLKKRVIEIENCIEIDLSNTDIYNSINVNNPKVTVYPGDLSYIIYTSGSTGTPKGVMLNQVGFANMARAMTKVLDYLKDGYNHTIASVTSTPFDIFVYEIFVSLTHGLKVVMANNAEHRNPKLLDILIRRYNVDVMTVTPSLMKINYDNREPDSALALVKNMVFGGEPLPEKFIKDLKALSSDITIYNIYGPSEITILSNVQNLDGEKEITVGPPIMNTQMYILDKNMNQVPIGVAGEIYIAGIQVGIGYIGKPEMTKSRFLDNPFGPGKIYKSGDIGRWTFDGKIQILGRIDHQIKLRGLRIELNEIENIMANIPNISSAVVNKVEIDGKESLCGYYVSEASIPESNIKDILRKTLPPYMVPTYIMHLDKMPYTINRKIDRKALPLPNSNKSNSDKKNTLQNFSTNEEKLLQIWKNILKYDNISLDDNFFDIGGDSISAIQMQIEAVKYGLNFEYSDIFNYPTIKQLSSKIPDSEFSFIQNQDYTEINKLLSNNTINNISSIKLAKINNILLIGGTGFLGAHIINEFIKQNAGDIYCIVRKKTNNDITSRLKQSLSFYFGSSYYEEFKNRLHIICGDISKPNLGLSDSDYHLIVNNVDAVINSGAIVKHYGLSKQFEDINVTGTQNVVDFCTLNKKRLLHISTISISGSGEKENSIEETPENINYKKHFRESNLFVGQNLRGIYTTTKYKAELIVLNAISKGLDAQILRLGNITSRYNDGVFQQNIEDNAFAKRVQSLIEIGAVPKYLLKHSIELTPVDLAAEAVIKILNYESSCNVFHIFNTKLMPITLLLETLDTLGYEIVPMSNEMFSLLLLGTLNDNSKKDRLSGIIYDLDDNKKLIYTYNIRLHGEFTTEYLKHIGFSWKEIDKDYIKKYINYFIKIHFLNKGDKNNE